MWFGQPYKNTCTDTCTYTSKLQCMHCEHTYLWDFERMQYMYKVTESTVHTDLHDCASSTLHSKVEFWKRRKQQQIQFRCLQEIFSRVRLTQYWNKPNQKTTLLAQNPGVVQVHAQETDYIKFCFIHVQVPVQRRTARVLTIQFNWQLFIIFQRGLAVAAVLITLEHNGKETSVISSRY